MTQEEATNWALKKIESAMNTKQPTAAAMRAAEKICVQIYAPSKRKHDPQWAAEIIDRETGLPELIEENKTLKRRIMELESELRAEFDYHRRANEH